MSAIQKRRKELRNELSLIEKQIYDLESTYLEDSRDFGNIFQGWGQYLSQDKTRPKKGVQNEERLFSLSSVTSPASRKAEKDKEKEKALAGGEESKKSKKKDKSSSSSSSSSSGGGNASTRVGDVKEGADIDSTAAAAVISGGGSSGSSGEADVGDKRKADDEGIEVEF